MSKWNGLNRNKRPRVARPKTIVRNKKWKQLCLERAEYLKEKYGRIVCEYSGETITVLSTVPNDWNEGWGHHLDGNRNHCEMSNVYICKYRYHTFIEDNNIKVKQEGFEGKVK